MHILVTGGLGFLGHAVTLNLLAAGHEVTVMTRGRADTKLPTGASLIVGDIRDRGRVEETIEAHLFHGICHLAAVTSGRDSLSDPLTYFDVNTVGTLNILTALDKMKGQRQPTAFVFASTNIVYGSRRTGALTEELDVRPESPYAASKLAAEQLISAYAATGAIGAIILRCFNIAGAIDGVGDRDPVRIIPNIFRAMTGRLPYVTLNGDGSAVRDFVHVADVADAFRLALKECATGKNQIYNVGSGVGVSMAEIVATAERVTGNAVKVERGPAKPEPLALTADITRITAGLGWRPSQSHLPSIIGDAWHAWDAQAP